MMFTPTLSTGSMAGVLRTMIYQHVAICLRTFLMRWHTRSLRFFLAQKMTCSCSSFSMLVSFALASCNIHRQARCHPWLCGEASLLTLPMPLMQCTPHLLQTSEHWASMSQAWREQSDNVCSTVDDGAAAGPVKC